MAAEGLFELLTQFVLPVVVNAGKMKGNRELDSGEAGQGPGLTGSEVIFLCRPYTEGVCKCGFYE